MPTVDENIAMWDRAYDWPQAGDEWSRFWGGVDMQWYGTLLPRIHAYVPAATILEIAPGYGRWTQYLKDLCQRLIVVDLSDKCIQACQERFRGYQHISYHVNDGRSLAFLADGSVDFAFSFDSLVHAEADVMQAYVAELARKLTANGVAFIHHSNLGEYTAELARIKRIPFGKGVLRKLGLIDSLNTHWRAGSVTAAGFAAMVAQNGLRCISQELINWGGGTRRLSDCISVCTPAGSVWVRDNVVVKNPDFMQERSYVALLARLYGGAARAGILDRQWP